MNCFSEEQLRRITNIVKEVEKLSDVEKLVLYLQLPYGRGDCHEDKHKLNGRHDFLLSRKPDQETTQTYTWILSHLEEDPNVSLPKQEVYDEYKTFCQLNNFEPLCVADFGKAMKHAFPCIKPRRLGQRGNSRYCYSGLRKKYKIQPPDLPDTSPFVNVVPKTKALVPISDSSSNHEYHSLPPTTTTDAAAATITTTHQISSAAATDPTTQPNYRQHRQQNLHLDLRESGAYKRNLSLTIASSSSSSSSSTSSTSSSHEMIHSDSHYLSTTLGNFNQATSIYTNYGAINLKIEPPNPAQHSPVQLPDNTTNMTVAQQQQQPFLADECKFRPQQPYDQSSQSSVITTVCDGNNNHNCNKQLASNNQLADNDSQLMHSDSATTTTTTTNTTTNTTTSIPNGQDGSQQTSNFSSVNYQLIEANDQHHNASSYNEHYEQNSVQRYGTPDDDDYRHHYHDLDRPIVSNTIPFSQTGQVSCLSGGYTSCHQSSMVAINGNPMEAQIVDQQQQQQQQQQEPTLTHQVNSRDLTVTMDHSHLHHNLNNNSNQNNNSSNSNLIQHQPQTHVHDHIQRQTNEQPPNPFLPSMNPNPMVGSAYNMPAQRQQQQLVPLADYQNLSHHQQHQHHHHRPRIFQNSPNSNGGGQQQVAASAARQLSLSAMVANKGNGVACGQLISGAEYSTSPFQSPASTPYSNCNTYSISPLAQQVDSNQYYGGDGFQHYQYGQK